MLKIKIKNLSDFYFGMCLCEHFDRFKLIKQRLDMWN